MHKLIQYIKRFRELPKNLRIGIYCLTGAVFFLYYPLGMLMIHRVNDNLDFDYTRFKPENGSESVAAITALVNREVNDTRFTPKDPFFMPSAMLERMPAFQRGILAACSRFAVELGDSLGRVRGSSQIDSDIEKAAGLLKYSPDIWIYDFKTSILPTASSEKQYRAAVKSLVRYNTRLGKGEAVFEKRADNLYATLDRITADIGSASAALDEHVRHYSGGFFDTDADIIFYEVKGKMYAYYHIMKALQADYANVIRERQMQAAWDQTMASLGEVASQSHFFVFNGDPDSVFVNNLTSQGFFLLRARHQMRELTAILQK